MVLEKDEIYSKTTDHLHDPLNWVQTSGKNVSTTSCTTNDIQMDSINQDINNYKNFITTNQTTLISNNNAPNEDYSIVNRLTKDHQYARSYNNNQLHKEHMENEKRQVDDMIFMQDIDIALMQSPSNSMQIDPIITTSSTTPLPNTPGIKKGILNDAKDTNNTNKEVHIDPTVTISSQPKYEQYSTPPSPLPIQPSDLCSTIKPTQSLTPVLGGTETHETCYLLQPGDQRTRFHPEHSKYTLPGTTHLERDEPSNE